MDVFQRARQVLREFLKANPEKVKKDLEEIQSKSEGNDIQHYLNQWEWNNESENNGK
jgi:hypothetical protein